MNQDIIAALIARAQAARQEALLAASDLDPTTLLTLPLKYHKSAEIDCGEYSAAAAYAAMAAIICEDAGYADAAMTYWHWSEVYSAQASSCGAGD